MPPHTSRTRSAAHASASAQRKKAMPADHLRAWRGSHRRASEELDRFATHGYFRYASLGSHGVPPYGDRELEILPSEKA